MKITLGNIKHSFNNSYRSMHVYHSVHSLSQSVSTLRHPNLVSLIGVSLDEEPFYIITEYMAKVKQPFLLIV